MVHYQNVDAIAAVVRGFEDCSSGKDDFTHAGHLTVALWYLHHYAFDEAGDRMRAGLFRFLDHHGVGREKYNETITAFWLKLVGDFAATKTSSGRTSTRAPDLTAGQLVATANALLQRFQDSKLIFDYYSESLIKSPAAKQQWLAPDLKQFDF